jgi:hypothetical protein
VRAWILNVEAFAEFFKPLRSACAVREAEKWRCCRPKIEWVVVKGVGEADLFEALFEEGTIK